jgi:hypothetical protein
MPAFAGMTETISAASSSRRSSVSPLLRHGSSLIPVSAGGRGPAQGSPRTQLKGSKPNPRSRQSPDQGLVAALSGAARDARQRHQQVGLQRAFRACAQYMQPVADLRLLELAQVSVELLQRGLLVGASAIPASRSRPLDCVSSRMRRLSAASRRRSRPEAM